MMRRLWPLLFVLVILAGPGRALLGEIGLNPFLNDSGARPLGMGAAFSGLADDVNSLLYNPGGLAWAKGISFTLRDFDNLTAIQAYPTGYGSSLGLGVVNSKISNIPIPSGVANSNSNVVLISYGTKLNFLPGIYRREQFQRVGVGLNIKALLGESLFRSGQSDRSASGWEMDLGILWKPDDWWSLGLTALNILPMKALGGGELKWDVGPEEGIAASERLAAAAKIIGDIDSPIFMEGRELTLGGELNFSSVNPALLRLGAEWSIEKTFFARTGIMQQAKPSGVTTNFNLGLGWRSESFGVDLVSYREPLRDEALTLFSFLYFPKDWVVIKSLDVDRPAVMLEEPFERFSLEDNLITYDNKIEVTGRVKPGVEAFINGLRADTSRDSTFKVVVPLKPEKNLIVVEARFEGEKKTWKYKVLRKAKVSVAGATTIKDKVEVLVTLGVIEVSPEAEFKLEASITRGELASWLVKAAALPLQRVENDPASDIKKDSPLAAYVKAALDWNLLKPFPDGSFRPNAPVSKEEGEKLFRLFGIKK